MQYECHFKGLRIISFSYIAAIAQSPERQSVQDLPPWASNWESIRLKHFWINSFDQTFSKKFETEGSLVQIRLAANSVLQNLTYTTTVVGTAKLRLQFRI